MSNIHVKKVINIQEYSRKDLIEKVRQVSMLTKPDVLPYLHTEISVLAEEPLYNFAPPQRYVLWDEIQKVRDLRNLLLPFGHDILCLNGYLEVTLQGIENEMYQETDVTILPPVIEVHKFPNNCTQEVICDGMHRIYLSILAGVTPNVVYIKGIDSVQFPYYAYPLVNGWADVEVRNDLPEGYCKKFHVQANYKDLYRNFDSQFKNCSKPRGRIIK